MVAVALVFLARFVAGPFKPSSALLLQLLSTIQELFFCYSSSFVLQTFFVEAVMRHYRLHAPSINVPAFVVLLLQWSFTDSTPDSTKKSCTHIERILTIFHGSCHYCRRTLLSITNCSEGQYLKCIFCVFIKPGDIET